MGRLRRRVDVVLHPLRRRIASTRLRAAPSPERVLFLCHGNLCRSPLAEALFHREMERDHPGTFETISAGFVGHDRKAPPEAVAAATKLGIDLSAHRSKLVTQDLLFGATLVVVMSAQQAAVVRGRFSPGAKVLVLGDLDPHSIETRTIRDPMNASAEVFDASYARIDRCVRALINLVTAP